jgi:hypothetical protein
MLISGWCQAHEPPSLLRFKSTTLCVTANVPECSLHNSLPAALGCVLLLPSHCSILLLKAVPPPFTTYPVMRRPIQCIAPWKKKHLGDISWSVHYVLGPPALMEKQQWEADLTAA